MQSREAVPPGVNPWTGHKISRKANPGTRPMKVKGGFSDVELIRLLTGNARVKSWPTYAYMPDVMILGMFTGARLESLCSLTVGSVKHSADSCTLTVGRAKSESDARLVGITSAAPVAVLRRRTAGREGHEQLFPELKIGGLDDKFSASVTKAFGRYRRACDVPDGTDFHAYRRNVLTILENAHAGDAAAMRFVGHKLGNLKGDTYSGGASEENTLATSRLIHYSDEVESLALMLARIGT
jgi:integrase